MVTRKERDAAPAGMNRLAGVVTLLGAPFTIVAVNPPVGAAEESTMRPVVV